MHQEMAETVARATREEAEQQAKNDLDQFRHHAVEAGRERSRKIIKVTLINKSTGTISYNPAGRLLRDWYLHVYINSLRTNLNQPSEVVDGQQIEDTSNLLRRVRPDESLHTMKAVGVVRDLAVGDADAAAARITERLHNAGVERAIRHAPDERFDGDPLRVHVTRHWYQRCYDNVVDGAVGVRHPLAPLTDAEMLEVGRILMTRDMQRLIGHDGVALAAVNGSVLKDLSRRLAAGQIAAAGSAQNEIARSDTLDPLRQRVRQAWADMDQEMRAAWLRIADAPQTSARWDWSHLAENRQAKLMQSYLQTYRFERGTGQSDRRRLEGPPTEAAREMFNHTSVLEGARNRTSRDPDSAPLGSERHGSVSDSRSADVPLQLGDSASTRRQL